MRKKLAFPLVVLQIFMALAPFRFNVYAAEKDEIVILPDAVTAVGGTVSATQIQSGDEEGHNYSSVTAPAELSFSFTASEDGYYKILVFGEHISTAVEFSASGEDIKELKPAHWNKSTGSGAYVTVGRYKFNAGTNSVALSVEGEGEFYFSKIVVKYVETKVNESGETLLPANDYLTADLNTESYEHIQWFRSTDESVEYSGVKGPVVTFAEDRVRQNAVYKLKNVVAGVYRVKVVADAWTDIAYDIELNGEIAASVYIQGHSSTNTPTFREAVFDTVNLPQGDCEIIFKSRAVKTRQSDNYAYTYYYTLERIGDICTVGKISANAPTIANAKDVILPGDGIRKNSETVSMIKGSKGIFYLDYPSACSAAYINYRAASTVKITLLYDNDVIYNGVLTASPDGYNKSLLYINSIHQGKKRAVIKAEGDIEISSFEFVPVSISALEDITEQLSNAQTDEELKKGLASLKTAGIDTEGLISGLVYTEPVINRLIYEDYSDITIFANKFIRIASNENERPYLTLLSDGRPAYKLESGNLTAEFDSAYLKDEQTVIMSIYEEENLFKIASAEADGAPKLTFTIGDVTLSKDKSYTLRFFYWNSFENLKPMTPFAEVYSDIYVDADAAPGGDGTELKPYNTIEAAFDKVDDINDNQWGDIIVHIAGGMYTLDEPLNLTADHGGKNGFSVKLVGDENDKPIISGGRNVAGWSEDGNGIWSASLDMEYVRNLYVNTYPAVPAKGDTLYRMGEIIKNVQGKPVGFKISKKEFPLYSASDSPFTNITASSLEDLEIVVNDDFEHFRIPVTGVAESGDDWVITLNADILSYSDAADRIIPENTFYAENALCFLDNPGEFTYTSSENKLYYMPYSGEDLTEAFVGDTEILLKAKGTAEDKIKNLSIENLVFRYGANNFISKYGYLGKQSDAIEWGNSNADDVQSYSAQVEIENADNIKILNCEFSCLGSTAVSLENSVTNSELTGNIIRDVSGSAVRIGHPDDRIKRMDRDICRNITVSNNLIRRTSAEMFNNVAISIYNEKHINVENNDISRLPYTGISAGWGWNTSDPYDCGDINIRNNKITDVVQTLDDGGAIYTLGKMYGSTISENYLSVTGDSPPSLIYQDSGSSGINVFNNIALTTGRAIFVQETVYGTRDLNYYSNYTDTGKINNPGEDASECNINIEGLNALTDDVASWNSTAQAIYENAGLNPEYKYLVNKDAFGERALRLTVPDKDKTTDSVQIYLNDTSKVTSIGAELITNGIDAGELNISPGGSFTANAEVNKSGYYKLLVYGRSSLENKASYDVYINGSTSAEADASTSVPGTTTIAFDAARRKLRWTIGRYRLNAGDNTIKFEIPGNSDSGIIAEYIVLKSVENDILPNVQNVVHMNDYLTSDITKLDQEDLQWHYQAPAGALIAIGGPVITNYTGSRTLTYRLNISEAGTYKMTVWSKRDSSKVSADFTVKNSNGATIGSASLPISQTPETAASAEMNVTLAAGEQIITLECNAHTEGSSGNDGVVYMYYYTLEKIN